MPRLNGSGKVFKRKADQVWFPGETISMGIGQGPITVTPLQQAHFAAEIAERGKIIATPRLVAATRAPGSVTVVPRSPSFMKPVDIATDEQWSVIFDGMEGAVTQRHGATASWRRGATLQVGRQNGHRSSGDGEANGKHQTQGGR